MASRRAAACCDLALRAQSRAGHGADPGRVVQERAATIAQEPRKGLVIPGAGQGGQLGGQCLGHSETRKADVTQCQGKVEAVDFGKSSNRRRQSKPTEIPRPSSNELAAFYANTVNSDDFLPAKTITNTICDMMLPCGFITPGVIPPESKGLHK